MTTIDRTVPQQTDSVAFEVDLRHRPEKVWRALTDPELLAQWLLPVTGFSLDRDAAFTLHTDPHPGWDGVVHCRILDVETYRTLRYAWAVGGMGLDTIVTFTLEPTELGTRLSIVQSGFKPEQKQNFGGARYGWRSMGARLVDLLDHTS